MFENPGDSTIREILAVSRRIAVVGCSPDASRDSNRIARLLIRHGHDVVPVNPSAESILDRVCYPKLKDVPPPLEMVDIFRRSDQAGDVVQDAIDLKARIVWMQLGVIDHAAAERAQRAGLVVVMDRCPAIEYARLF